MDAAYLGKLFLSILIFAPGVIVLALALFVGLLVLLEKSGVFARMTQSRTAPTVATGGEANPPAGRVVDELKRSLAAEGEGATDERSTKTGS